MKIKNTEFEAQHPWPADIPLLQGGSSGLVFRPEAQGGNYGTAFVEAFPQGTFIRGEGPTVPEAEDHCWKQYLRVTGCPGHEYEPRRYTNGAGFCKHCGDFGSRVFTPEQLGLYCFVCGVPTYWSSWDDGTGKKFYCEDHAVDPDTEWLRKHSTGSLLGDLFARLDADAKTEGSGHEDHQPDEN